MYFVSSIKDDLIGVTDTKDWKEDFVSKSLVARMYLMKGIKVIGTEIFDKEVKRVTQIKVGVALSSNRLNEVLKDYRNRHNPWEALKVTEYLATARVGTVITIDYTFIGDGDRRKHYETSIITRKDWDSWLFEDTSSEFNGIMIDTESILDYLEISTMYSTPTKISIRG